MSVKLVENPGYWWGPLPLKALSLPLEIPSNHTGILRCGTSEFATIELTHAETGEKSSCVAIYREGDPSIRAGMVIKR